MDWLASGSGILLALLGIGFVIVVHELGHFLFAKWAGVRVDTFSIGFGPIVWSRTVGETEYAVSLLPLGGYVQMREEPDGTGRSFVEQHAGWRALILSAGVLFNLVSSYLLLVCLAWYGMPMRPPVVGAIAGHVATDDGTLRPVPARELGLRQGDRILAYNGHPVRAFDDLIGLVLQESTEPIELTVERDGEIIELPRGDEPVRPVFSERLGRAVLGVDPPQSRRIHSVIGGAGKVEPGAVVTAVEGSSVEGLFGEQVHDLLLPHIGREVRLTLRQEGEERTVDVRYAGSSAADLIPARLGLPVQIARVLPDLPAARAGLRPGDVLAAVDGEVVSSQGHFLSLVRRAIAGDGPVRLAVLRHAPEAAHPAEADDGPPPGWRRLELELRAELDPATGRELIGIVMSPVRSGPLPILPPVLGGERRPLVEAGLRPGDVLVGFEPLPGEGEAPASDRVRVRYLRGGTLERIPYGPADGQEMLRSAEPPVLLKFLGAQAPPPLERLLVGGRVAEVLEDRPALRLVRPGGDETALARLDALTSRLRERLLALEPGDWIVDVDTAGPEGGVIEVLRAPATAEPATAEVEPADVGAVIVFLPELRPYELSSWTEAFGLAADRSLGIVATTFQIIGRFFVPAEQGGVDPTKSLHGPIGIFSELKVRAELLGFASFLDLVALLGINLFIINLLPVPLVDGGRLLLLGIEVIIRRPVPERVANILNTAGLIFLVLLMLFVIGLDILREMDRH